MALEYDDDLKIEEVSDQLTFSMDRHLLDWEAIDELSDAEPGSRQYRRLMNRLHINGRDTSIGIPRWRDEEEDY